MRRAGFFLLGVIALLAGVPSGALAGGYDTPILYTARHIGMGGTAIAWVDDPSAMFHNPAGLGHTKLATATAAFSPLIGIINASPDREGQNAKAGPAFAPFFLAGGSLRVHDNITLGLAIYPVASAGAIYEYDNSVGIATKDETKLVFIEISPGIAVNFPELGLRIGAGYRVSLVQLDRFKGAVSGNRPLFDLGLSGWNFAGVRLGVQWQPISQLELGLVYRHRTRTEVSGDTATVVGTEFGKTTMHFVLPSKLGFGARTQLGPVGVALDLEWGFYSQNDTETIVAEQKSGGAPLEIESISKWNDALTARVGVEYAFLPVFAARVGYIFDGKVANEQFPTAFGTPPTPTHSFTVGAGFRPGPFEVNLAYAYRVGSTSITKSDFAGRDPAFCLPCSQTGDYKLQLHGIYLDFSYYFD